MLSRLVITFLPRSKCLLISWLQSPSAVILEPRKIKSATVSTFSPSSCHEWGTLYVDAQSRTRLMWLSSSSSICHEMMGPDAMILGFWMLKFKPAFPLSSRGSLVPLCFLLLEWYHLHRWGSWYWSWQSPLQLVIHATWPKKIKSVTIPIASSSICHEMMGLHAMI